MLRFYFARASSSQWTFVWITSNDKATVLRPITCSKLVRLEIYSGFFFWFTSQPLVKAMKSSTLYFANLCFDHSTTELSALWKWWANWFSSSISFQTLLTSNWTRWSKKIDRLTINIRFRDWCQLLFSTCACWFIGRLWRYRNDGMRRWRNIDHQRITLQCNL